MIGSIQVPYLEWSSLMPKPFQNVVVVVDTIVLNDYYIDLNENHIEHL